MVLYTAMPIGWMLLLHACYSAAIYKSDQGLPSDIVIQTLVGALCCAVTCVWHYGKFDSIVSSNDSTTATSDFLMSYKASPGFMNLRHRGYFYNHKNDEAFNGESPVHRRKTTEDDDSQPKSEPPTAVPEHDDNGPQIQEIE